MLKDILTKIKTELAYYRALAADPGTPGVSRWLIGLALVYLANPIDLIPDFVPVIGHLDDLVIVPSLIWLALRLVPAEVKRSCREKAGKLP